jgi:hypothetical protein
VFIRMSNQKLRFALVLPTFLFAFALVVLNAPQSVLSAASHIVISEIMVGVSGTADNEFVELYNPTGSTVDLSGWRLTRKTDTGTQSTLVASMSGTIAPHGYMLVGSPEFVGSASADLTYSTATHLAANNTVLLYSDEGVTVVDKVGMGTATDVESTSAANPATGKSIERKANASSTIASMIIGGIDEFLGNGEDTGHNLNDFIVRDLPQPQNASSSVEPVMATPTPSSTESASPSATPVVTPTPSPTVTPSPVVTPTPSSTASATPSATPVVTPTPTISPTPLPIPSPSVIASFPLFNGQAHVCTLSYTQLTFGFFTFNMPQVSCVTTQL